MENRQPKSSSRMTDLGKVYISMREHILILDIVKPNADMKNSFLEFACGDCDE